MISILAALPVSLSSIKKVSEYLGDNVCFSTSERINIGSSRQLFVDDYLIHNMGEELKLILHYPIPHEVVITFDQHWEGAIVLTMAFLKMMIYILCIMLE